MKISKSFRIFFPGHPRFGPPQKSICPATVLYMYILFVLTDYAVATLIYCVMLNVIACSAAAFRPIFIFFLNISISGDLSITVPQLTIQVCAQCGYPNVSDLDLSSATPLTVANF